MTLSPRLRQGVQSLALAMLMAGITTAGVKVFGWKIWPRPPAAPPPSVRLHAPSLAHDQRLVAVAREPEPAHPPSASATVAAIIARRNLSASEMFAAAKLARARGDMAEALRLSKQI